MRTLPGAFAAYTWAPSTEELARRIGVDPIEIVRFDGNVPAWPAASARPATVASSLARVNEYAHGGYPELLGAIAVYAGVEAENIVLGAGADDLILLCARAFAGPGDQIAIAEEPTYPLYAIAAALAGADVGSDDPVVTFCCRPNNPTGALDPLPAARPLVVDEAYCEYAGDTAVGLIDEGVVVLRTFSKAFALAGARVGYALADPETAAELNRRQAPQAVSSISASLALAGLADPPDVTAEIEERERLARAVRALGLEPLPSWTNFLFLPLEQPETVGDALLRQGLVVRVFDDGIRFNVRDREDDDRLLEGLAHAFDRPAPVAPAGTRSTRTLRATAETRIRVRLSLNGASRVRVSTGVGLYDHLFEQLAFHAGFDLVLEAVGDLETGPHHTVEDAALALGEALDRALGDRRGIARYGDAVVPMDDALARASIDLGGRAWADIRLEREPGLAQHALQSLAQAGRLALHVESTGNDDHHVAEAAFKAVGRALRLAVRAESAGVPSTKGVL
ncbi:MAG TPA: aminotransferase class I/II-fold pyridoxal phosphate-dependent enzyme [Gaiellaceae bacterium]|jgi:histidinol-phosphate/aromatic aminotransferase/cobyric acid decarboxylase-like protein/imidazoleglycerol phosphate dehydratase HisB